MASMASLARSCQPSEVCQCWDHTNQRHKAIDHGGDRALHVVFQHALCYNTGSTSQSHSAAAGPGWVLGPAVLEGPAAHHSQVKLHGLHANLARRDWKNHRQPEPAGLRMGE